MSKKLCILDFVGTLYNGTNLFSGAKEFVATLKSHGFTIVVISNSSFYSKEFIAEALKDTEIESDNIFTVYSMTVNALRKANQKSLYFIGPESFRESLIKDGFSVYRSEEHETTSIEEVKLIDDISSVVVATDKSFNYFKAALGTRYVIEKKAAFYSIGGDRRFIENDHFYPGSFTLATSIETPSFINPIIVGKPNSESIKEIFDFTKFDLVWVVGDNEETDVEFAKNANVKSALILTGVTQENQKTSATIVTKNLEEAAEKIIKYN